MARKNLFEAVESDSPPRDPELHRKPLERPLMRSDRAPRPASPVGASAQSLESINSRAQRADEIERKLAEGQAVIELDPALIDSSFIVDRLEVDDEHQAALVSQVREHGQQVPILVRPHPEREGRFQVAYGHRRLAAVKEIGRKVRAVVRALSDEQLVVSQGQENNSRTDLSYIERCYFAARLQDRGFSRDIIMAALGVDKAALSRMISLVGRLPAELIEAIGSAPSFGRQRWGELAYMLEERGKRTKAQRLANEDGFSANKSDQRFQVIYDGLKSPVERSRTAVWSTPGGTKPVKITESDSKVTLSFDKRIEPEFGAFVQERLNALYDEYRSSKPEE